LLDAGIHLLVLALAVPAISSLLLHFKLQELAKDKLIAQISGILLVIGSGTLFIAGSLVLLVISQLLTSLGSAFGDKQLHRATISHSNLTISLLFEFGMPLLQDNSISTKIRK